MSPGERHHEYRTHVPSVYDSWYLSPILMVPVFMGADNQDVVK